MFTQMQATCNTCQGKGKTVARPCSHCRGNKVIQSDNNLSFYLPPGAAEGFEMLFDGEADESPEWDIPGDVLVKVYARRDDEWRRKDAGLYRREIIGVDEALLGFDRNLTHLDGRIVNIVRPGTTQPGHIDVIKGEGVSRFSVCRSAHQGMLTLFSASQDARSRTSTAWRPVHRVFSRNALKRLRLR